MLLAIKIKAVNVAHHFLSSVGVIVGVSNTLQSLKINLYFIFSRTNLKQALCLLLYWIVHVN